MPKDFSQDTTEQKRALRIFTDREEFQEAFWKRFKALNEDEQSVLYFYGVGGIGKSALLAELQRQLRQLPHQKHPPSHKREVSYGWVNFQIPAHRHAPTALLQLRETLVETGDISLPTFDIAYAHYYLKIYKEEYPKGLADLATHLSAGTLDRKVLLPLAAEIPGLNQLFKAGNIFSNALGLHKRQVRIQNDRELRSFLFEADPLKMATRLVDFFAADLRAAVKRSKTAVLFMDTLESLTSSGATAYAGEKPDRWVERLAGKLPGVLLVISGRRALDWSVRDADWQQRDLLETHLVGGLVPEDARKFLTSAGIPGEVTDIVLQSYQGLPFFLDLAVDMFEQGIVRTGCELKPEVFRGSTAEVTERFLSYLSVAEQSAVRVLSAPRFFNYELFKELMEEFGTAYPRDIESFQKLLRYSLFKLEDEQYYVHEVARNFLAGSTQRSVREYILKKAAILLSENAEQASLPHLLSAIEEGYHQVQFLSDHVKAIQWVTEHRLPFYQPKRAALIIGLMQEGLPIMANSEVSQNEKLNYLNLVGLYLTQGGQYTEATELLKQAAVGYIQTYGRKDEHTVIIRSHYTSSLRRVGRYKEALIFDKELYEDCLELFGPTASRTLRQQNNVAIGLQSTGKVREAHPVFHDLVANAKIYLAADDDDRCTYISNWAMSLYHLGNYGQAEIAYRELIVELQQQSPISEKSIEECKSKLVLCLLRLNRAEEALVLCHEVNNFNKQIYGAAHPATLPARNNLGLCYFDSRQFDRAKKVYEATLHDSRLLLGADHPQTLTTQDNLARCFESMGLHDQALSLYLTTVEQRRQSLGEDHPGTLTTMANAAYLYNISGQSKEALDIYRHVYNERISQLGPLHKDTLTAQANIAWSLSIANRKEEALELYRENLSNSIEVFGADHPSTLTIKANLARCLDDLTLFAEALPLHATAWRGFLRIWPETHPQVLHSAINYGYTLRALGQFEEALSIYEQYKELCQESLGKHHDTTLNCMNGIAACLMGLGRSAEALPLFVEVLDGRTIAFGEPHAHVDVSKASLAGCMASLAQPVKALKLYNAAISGHLSRWEMDFRYIDKIEADYVELVHQLKENIQVEKLLTEAKNLLDQVELKRQMHSGS